jgi:hypothetical protein
MRFMSSALDWSSIAAIYCCSQDTLLPSLLMLLLLPSLLLLLLLPGCAWLPAFHATGRTMSTSSAAGACLTAASR